MIYQPIPPLQNLAVHDCTFVGDEAESQKDAPADALTASDESKGKIDIEQKSCEQSLRGVFCVVGAWCFAAYCVLIFVLLLGIFAILTSGYRRWLWVDDVDVTVTAG